ncbi:hypothetical protein RvY_17353 [Ramazzottius varieornatus]|uniref:DNA-directed DNA polymerase n=1 Tax=Ramazzottius varieornatus TaxID=947166 RepID=A0A1D1W5R5_RAMVA|nr:hypothetical protein RvY_17353 [Ramazzottius varieornatus]
MEQLHNRTLQREKILRNLGYRIQFVWEYEFDRKRAGNFGYRTLTSSAAISEYPFVNKVKTYPVGGHKVIRDNFQDIRAYYGLAFIKILPPKDMWIPVLPFRTDKLISPYALRAHKGKCLNMDTAS